jgi:hypothetical protein
MLMARQLTAASRAADPALPIVCVDLNGVLDRYRGWKDPAHWDPPRRGAAGFLARLASEFQVIVFTTRYAPDARRWLRRHDLLRHVTAVTDRKPAAHVFVDDRAVCFTGSFRAALASVRSFKAHWEETGDRRVKAARSRPTNRSRRRSKRAASGEPRSD